MSSGMTIDRFRAFGLTIALLIAVAASKPTRAENHGATSNASGAGKSNEWNIGATNGVERLASLERPMGGNAGKALSVHRTRRTAKSTESGPDDDPVEGAVSDTPTYERGDVLASIEYFDSVTKHVRELKARKGAVTYGQIGRWIEICALRIERLPILDVDAQLVEYGRAVASDLRDAVAEIKSSGIRASSRQAQIQPEFHGNVAYYRAWPYYGYWGWRHGYWRYYGDVAYWHSDVRTIKGERRKVRAQERETAAQAHRLAMQEIAHRTAEIRWQMTDKYQVEF